jgi:hypothetical protein
MNEKEVKKSVREILGYTLMIFAVCLFLGIAGYVTFGLIKKSKTNAEEEKRTYYTERKDKSDKCKQETQAVICQLGKPCFCTCSNIITEMKESCILTSINDKGFSFKISSYFTPITFPITAKIINVYGIEFEVLNIWKDSIGIKRLYKKEG